MPEQRWRPRIVKPDPNLTWIENLRYSIDLFDARDNLIEVLGRLANIDAARAAFKT